MSNFEKKVVPYLTYLGLRPGEKLYEEKLMAEEGLKKTRNELIHCEFDGVETVLQEDGRYCCVPATHKVTLGENLLNPLRKFVSGLNS